MEINQVVIISIDKNDDPWAIEGEIFFEADLTSPFSAAYFAEDDELDNLEIEIVPGNIDKKLLKDLILSAAAEFDETL